MNFKTKSFVFDLGKFGIFPTLANRLRKSSCFFFRMVALGEKIQIFELVIG
jgi:hypothetical protein